MLVAAAAATRAAMPPLRQRRHYHAIIFGHRHFAMPPFRFAIRYFDHAA
jgi:hypothetical protein